MRRQCGPRQRLQLRKKTVRQRRWCIALRRRQRSPTATADISRDQLLRLSRLMSCGNQVVVVARSTYASLRCLLLTRTSCCVLPAEQCGRVAAQLVDGFHQLTPANRRGGWSSLLLCCLLIFLVEEFFWVHFMTNASNILGLESFFVWLGLQNIYQGSVYTSLVCNPWLLQS